jgi:hypothetical protein
MLQFNNFSHMLLTMVRSSLNNKAKDISELNENTRFSLSIRIRIFAWQQTIPGSLCVYVRIRLNVI